jgi:predicted nucleic acid-binding protein
MTASAFVDTNVLLYAGSQHPEDQAKRGIALELLKRQDLGFSSQVMAEYFNAAYSKARLGISLETAISNLEILSKRPVLSITPAIVIDAARIVTRYQISYYDAAIVAAATELGCTTLYSEDLSHGQFYGTVQVINPFI